MREVERDRFLDRADHDLVAEQGYQGATIETIVRRAKVGYATIPAVVAAAASS